MRCPDCDEPLNDLWVCEFCQVDYEPSQELKNKVIREFLDKSGIKNYLLTQWKTAEVLYEDIRPILEMIDKLEDKKE